MMNTQPSHLNLIRHAVMGCIIVALVACSAETPQESSSTAAPEPVEQAQTEPRNQDATEATNLESQAVESEFPYFELTSLDGSTWRLTDQGDQPKLLMFWATWCPYCKKIFPTIQALHEAYGEQIKVAAISIRDDGDVAAYVAERGLTMDILLEGDAVGDLYEVPGTPAILLLDGNNEIVYGTLSSDSETNGLREAVEAIVGGSEDLAS